MSEGDRSARAMSDRVGIKICGITRLADALIALEAGADALGFVLHSGSSRRLGPEAAATLLERVRGATARPFLGVAVLDEVTPEAARQALEGLGFDRAQLHGRADAMALASCLAALGPLAARTWGVAHVGTTAPDGYAALECEAVLLDRDGPGPGGGGGVPFDWARATALARARKVVLGAGLSADNVEAAIAAVSPWMVDVSSGVESAPGIKDRRRIDAFVAAVRRAG